MFNPNEIYNIGRPMNHCLLCGADIIEQEKHPSMIDYSEMDSVRKDYCFNCWQKIENRQFFSFWIAKRIKPGPDKRTTRAERNKILIQLFLSLYNSGEKHRYRSHLFLLAHLLMKYNVFKWKETISANDIKDNAEMNLSLDINAIKEDDSELQSSKNDENPQEEFIASSFIVFIQKDTGEEFTIEDVPLDDESLVEIKKEIDANLEGKEI